MEIIFAALAEAIFSVLIQDLAERPKLVVLRNRLRGDSSENLALQRSIAATYLDFSRRYPDLASSLFDEYFLGKPEVITQLAKLLSPDQVPDRLVLEEAWRAQFFSPPDVRLEEPFACFIETLEREIKAQPQLKPFIDSRALDQLYSLSQQGQEQVLLQTQMRNLLTEVRDLISQASQISDSVLPPLPRPYIAHPYPLPEHLIERTYEHTVLSDWLKSKERVIVITAIGGMGKSALIWDWMEENVLGRESFDGLIWWSFYESTSFDEFSRNALAYVSGAQAKSASTTFEITTWLYQVLAQRRFLVILDGFERQLKAYHRLDAAYMLEEGKDVSRDFGFSGSSRKVEVRDSRRCFDPSAGRFLQWISTSGTESKFILTSRLVPYELDSELGRARGCKIHHLNGFRENEALAFFSSHGISGNTQRILAVCDHFGYHPLSLRLLVGLLSTNLIFQDPDIGLAKDFFPDVWSHSKGPAYAVKVSYDNLKPLERRFLSWCATFKQNLTIDELFTIYHLMVTNRAVLQNKSDYVSNLRDLIAPVVPSWMYRFDLGGRQRTVLGEEMETERRQKTMQMATGESQERIRLVGGWDTKLTKSPKDDRAVRSLVNVLIDSGLLRKQQMVFSLHPIVQAYAYSRLAHRSQTHLRLAGYYATKFTNSTLHTLNDLKPGIELYRHLVSAGEFDLACDYLLLHLTQALFFDFGSYHILRELVMELFDGAIEAPPRLRDESAQAQILSLMSRILSKTGESRPAIRTRMEQIRIRKKHSDLINQSAGYGYLSLDQMLLGDLVGAVESLEASLELLESVGEHKTDSNDIWLIQRAQHLTFYSTVLIHIGQSQASQEANDRARIAWENLDHHRVGLSAVHQNFALLSLFQGTIDSAITEASQALMEAEKEQYERGIILSKWLLGAAYCADGLYDAAKLHILDSLTRCRSTNFAESEPDILLEWARWNYHQSEYQYAIEIANEALEIASKFEYRLKLADVHLFLAECCRSKSDIEAAMSHCKRSLDYALSSRWEEYIVGSEWSEDWWSACIADWRMRQQEPWRENVLSRKCGYKPCMDSALKLWHSLSSQ